MKKCYIRFGDIPESKLSKNYLTGESEKGVSVYRAFVKDGNIIPIISSLEPSILVTLVGCLSRNVYIVYGDKIGIGSDGEILLENVTKSSEKVFVNTT